MMTEIQKIILTCLLGPEDTGAFASERKLHLGREKSRKHRFKFPNQQKENREADPEKYKKISRDSKRRARQDPLVRAVECVETKKWVKENPEKSRRSQRDARAKQKKRDPSCKLAPNLRTRMGGVLKGKSKSAASLKLLGCKIEEWKIYLEALFRPGMSWENYGPVWHVDHIKPCDSFDLTDPEQQRACFNWRNTQPLFALENLKKGGSYHNRE